MNYRFSFLLCFLILFSCKTEKQKTQDGLDPLPKKVEKDLSRKETHDNTWQFVGFYTGDKQADNQQLTYDVLLWKKNERYLGYLYEMWYVTDSNFGESQSKLEGKKTGNTISLKGNLEEDFDLAISDFTSQAFQLDIDFPTHSSRSLHAVEMKSKQLEKWLESVNQASDEEKINVFIEKLLKDEMRHSGY